MITVPCTAHFLLASHGGLLQFASDRKPRTGLPALQTSWFQLELKIFAIGLAVVKFKRLPGLRTIHYRLVQSLKHRLVPGVVV